MSATTKIHGGVLPDHRCGGAGSPPGSPVVAEMRGEHAETQEIEAELVHPPALAPSKRGPWTCSSCFLQKDKEKIHGKTSSLGLDQTRRQALECLPSRGGAGSQAVP